MSEKPFSREEYALEGATLTRLDEAGAAQAARFLVVSEPWATLAYTRAGLERYLAAPDPTLKRYAVRGKGELMGVVAVRDPWLKGPYLELIGLREEYRGAGLGGQLMEWFEGEAAAGGGNAWVIVSDFNRRARNFYASRGFEPVGELPGLTSETRNEILLRKRLD